MKILFYIICNLLLFFGNAFSQPYFKLVNTGVSWTEVVQNTIPDSSGMKSYYSQSVYFMGRDTVISDYGCTALHMTDFSGDTIPVPDEGNKLGYLYENHNKQVFYLNMYCCTGVLNLLLVYDFSKLPGDTIMFTTDTTSLVYARNYLVVSFIDSVFVDNSYRKQFHFSNSDDVWIEGIGSVHGVLFPINNLFDCICEPWLVCYKYENETKYMNTGFQTCYPGRSSSFVMKEDRGTFMKIYPNPVHGCSLVSWDLPVDRSSGYEIYNASGSMVEKGIPGGNSLVIESNSFSRGIYFIRVYSENTAISGKFIIQ